jgi:hypoxanthine phosphoribosyltransferase
MLTEVKHWHVTYNDIHNLIRSATPKIAEEFNPELLIAIGMHSFIVNSLSLLLICFAVIQVEGQ